MTLTGKWDDDAAFNYRGVERAVMRADDLVEGMRVRLPSGQVATVVKVSEPDANGAITATLEVGSSVERPD